MSGQTFVMIDFIERGFMNRDHLYESDTLPRSTGGWRRPGGADLTRQAVSLAGLYAGDAVIDVGCGSGETVFLLRTELSMQAVGVDKSPALIALGKQKFPGLPIEVGNMEKLRYASGSFSAALAECALSLTEQPYKALTEIRRCLRYGGKLLVSDVYLRSDAPEEVGAGQEKHCCLQGAVGKKEILERFTTCGFSPLCFQDHTPLYKSLIAQLIMDNGSMLDFWQRFIGDSSCSCCQQDMAWLRKAKIGYYLAICQAV